MELGIIYLIIIFIIVYLFYRILYDPTKKINREIEKIVNSDDYKVRGQFD